MQEIQENSLNNNDDDSMPLTKTKTKKSEEKPNLQKIRSQKQIDAFNKTMEIRKQKVEERKHAKLLESAKILVEKHGKKDDQPKNNKITPFQKYADSSDELSKIIVFFEGFFLCFSFVCFTFGFTLCLFLTTIISSSSDDDDSVD